MSALDRLDRHRQVVDLYAGVRAELYPHVAHAGWCAVRDQLYAEHPASPHPGTFRGFVVGDYDAAWRVTARLEAAAPQRISLAGSTFDRVGTVRTPWGVLDAWEVAGHGGGLWIPVRDAGSGTVSFSGGRYLYDTGAGADLGTNLDGELVLDLNFLYAPDCAHDPRLACALPPDGNALDVVVPVGELRA